MPRASTAAWARPWSLGFDLIVAAALGALQTAAHVYTEFWWLQLLCVGMLAWRACVAEPARAFAIGLTFGTAWLVAGTWWMFISMHQYGGLPAWMAAAAVLALSAVLSLYLGTALLLFARWRSARPLPDALLFASLWLLAELARGVLFTGFPWVASGYAHVDGPLAKLAPWIGVYGIGAVAAFLAAWVALARPRIGVRRTAGIVVAAGLLGYVDAHTGPVKFTTPTGTLDVTLLQGNIPQEEKFASEHQGAALEWHVNGMLSARSDLVLAPETAVPFLPQQMPEGFWAGLRERFASGRTHALFGVPLGDDRSGYTNSAVGFAPGRPEYRYDKHHLVPFGEFIPPGFRWFTQMMNIPLGDFNRGALEAPSFAVRSERVAPNICYEDLFGEELAARFRHPATAPTMFANLSNIGWFGDTIAVDQHLNISRMRSLEFQRPMLRATNTGATAVIDHRGHVAQGLKPYTRGVLDGAVQGREGLTPFAAWAARYSLWPLAAFAVAAVLLLRWWSRRR
ncbi:apolipoprotein N-acyltransferase [Piscinibacter sp. XHJ-5]|uniref:apolipoprotein N-acyltransferase n=1 Tax=Piscinibacter sp. XHJ-5 TaxID=3037797 RepID=UPI002452899F|nr:apolipoprotein N-acyltransferase [Piscinibacter sp. XHJ-5]